jgi:hypothetical protein
MERGFLVAGASVLILLLIRRMKPSEAPHLR